MQGRITKGTTLRGRAVNAGEVIEISPDDFNQLKLTGDIEEVENHQESEPEKDSKPVTKKKK